MFLLYYFTVARNFNHIIYDNMVKGKENVKGEVMARVIHTF